PDPGQALRAGADQGLVSSHRRYPRAAPEAAGRAAVDALVETTHTPTREEAWGYVCELTESAQLRRHMQAVEAAMRAYAKRFGEDEQGWAVLGLIHDWDYESGPTPEQHPVRGIAMLRERGWPEELLEDIA